MAWRRLLSAKGRFDQRPAVAEDQYMWTALAKLRHLARFVRAVTRNLVEASSPRSADLRK
jgi:hypothetical protein